MKKNAKMALLFVPMLAFIACDKNKDRVVDGYKPIYQDKEELQKIETSSTRELNNPGKIYRYENLLLVNEKGEGIHIYDNVNPSSPTELSFVKIPGNMDFSVRNDRIYADNMFDMVVIDITNPSSPSYSTRISDVFPAQNFPDEFGAFECVDPSKGVVVGWEKAQLTNPKCHK